MRFSSRWHLINWIPIALFLIGILLVSPWGEYPLNDDWSYARVVEGITERGVIDVAQGWASMTLMSIVAWGAAFCSVFGFSHAVLRVSTIVAAIVILAFLPKLLRQDEKNGYFVGVSVLLLASNPIFFNLSTTFMTDVAYLMFVIVTVLAVKRVLLDSRSGDYLLFCVLLSFCMFARQFAALIAVAFAFSYVLRYGLDPRSLRRAILPSLICVAIYFVHQYVLYPKLGFPDLRSVYADRMFARFDEPIHLFILLWARSIVGLLLTLGLFLSPLLLLRFQGLQDFVGYRVRHMFVAGVWYIVAVAVTLQANKIMPLLRNIVYDFGSGPPRLKDVVALNDGHVPADAPTWFWVVITVICVLLGGLLVQELFKSAERIVAVSRKPSSEDAFFVFAVAFSVLYVVVIILAGFFDRFMIQLLPFILIIFAVTFRDSSRTTFSRLRISAAVAACLVLLAFSVASTHDYHSWNDARWEALDRLARMGITPDEIDGGIEYNGVHFFDREFEHKDGKSWWWVRDDLYAVTFRPLEGYEVIDEVKFATWLPWTVTNSIKILKRQA